MKKLTSQTKELRKLCKDTDISQAELSRKLKVTRSCISMIMSGDRRIGKAVAKRAARLFKVPASTFQEGW